MLTSSNQRKLTFNCLLKDIKGSKCCVFKVRQYSYMHYMQNFFLCSFFLFLVETCPLSQQSDCIQGYLLHGCNNWAPSRQNLSSGFPTKQVSNQSSQLQGLARKLKFHLEQIHIIL